MKPTIVITEDHPGCLETIRNLIGQDYQVVAVATDGKTGLHAALTSRAEVVILDIELPKLNGIAVARELRRRGLNSRILFLTVHEEPEFRESAFLAGANGYVFKSQMTADLTFALKEILAGRTFLSDAAEK